VAPERLAGDGVAAGVDYPSRDRYAQAAPDARDGLGVAGLLADEDAGAHARDEGAGAVAHAAGDVAQVLAG
jgi:hypothetical protein